VSDSSESINRALWDERAARHGQDTYYDLEGFLAGGSSLREVELGLLPDVTGLDLLHLQCHFGLDTLSWARRGGRVTGVDFSPVAVERARALADQVGLDADFVEADTQRLPALLDGRFDVVFASYGVLPWIADLDAWMGGATRALRPGGRLVLVELHPAGTMVDSVDPLVVDYPYGGGVPQRFTAPGSYADRELATVANDSVEHPHGLGEVVTAAVGAGLTVRELREYVDTDRDDRGMMIRGEDGRYRIPFGDQFLPVLYALVAERLAG
jgi:SAM-dependent methyltransferase